MATVNIANSFYTYVAKQADTTYVLAEGVKIEGAQAGIVGTGEAANSSYEIDGSIAAATDAIYVSHNTTSAITIGATGFIDVGHNGVSTDGKDMTIANKGTIIASTTIDDGTGIQHTGMNAHISNSGLIDAHWGISVSAGSFSATDDLVAQIVNSGNIHGEQSGIWSLSTSGITRIINSGSISGHESAIETGAGRDIVINSGMLNGDVDLGAGNDVFRSKGGHVNGDVIGGTGDDTYYVDNVHTTIVEYANDDGYDRMYSSISRMVGNGIEDVSLVGKTNINLMATRSRPS